MGGEGDPHVGADPPRGWGDIWSEQTPLGIERPLRSGDRRENRRCQGKVTQLVSQGDTPIRIATPGEFSDIPGHSRRFGSTRETRCQGDILVTGDAPRN